MKRYIDADRLKAEVRRQKHELELSIKSQGDYGQSCHILAYENILSLIDSLQQDKDVLDLCSQVWWEERGWIMIPPNVTLEGIDTLLKQVRKKLPQYYKLRDIETGRTFMAEFSEIAGEWYEKGTGEAHSIASVEMVKEQPEPTCKTCGFYENNCPFIRGKLIPYPNKVCKDYTYSAMKEQSQVADASKMEQPEVDEPEYGPYARQYPKSEVSQEQPEVELEKEIELCWMNWLSPSNQKEVEGILPKTEFEMYTRHFAEWGATHLNTRKE